ncbi:Rossmann-like fold-containing protein [Microseira sp. BLCC-F43]|jgi:hypothetical protein|uniref:Rossmann-like fold-containing protein n=1 Tax=Microseira sp. BLCC-F43 TaxID=3153602 RepID=UPI0035B9FA4C
MSERSYAQTKNSATPSQATQSSSPLFKQRRFTDERYEAVAKDATISTEGGSQQPKIARAGLNWRNISIEAPPRAVESSTYPGGIQRKEEEEQLAEAPTIQRQVSAESEEKSTEEACNSTRSTAGPAQQQKIARAGFNWRNIAIEAPSRAGVSSTYRGGIQRQQTSESKQEEDRNESLQMQSDGAIQAKCSECEQQEKQQQNNESVQTKLTVGAPGDKYEQEADNMAAKVMTMPDSALQQPIQRQTEAEQEQLQTQPLGNTITPLVQRSGDRSTQASSSIESRLNSSKGGGSPLPDDVRSFMEPRFGADFSSIKVHNDSNAVQMNKELGAQAFAHGSDIYYGAGKSPGKNELTAHELTHTIQQGAAVRMNKQVRLKPQQEEEQETLQAKEIFSVQEDRQGLKSHSLSSSRLKPTINNIASPLQRTLAISPEIDFRAVDDSKQATPLNFESSFFRSETPGDTIAAKEIPSYNPNLSQNKELRQKPLDEEQEETLDEPIQAKQFTNSSHFNNKNTIQRQSLAVSSVSPRIQGDFLGIGNPIDKIKGAIAGFASRLPGYPLLTLILGKDPISDAPVQRNATNLVRGLLSLVPNGDNIFNNLQQSGSLQKGFDWFNGEIAKLNLTWDAIKRLFGKALNSLGVRDALNPVGAFEKVKNVFLEPIGRIKNFAVSAGTKVMEFAFEGFLNMAGGAGAKVMGILRKAGGVFTSILKDPVGFCGNLVGAVRGGFQKFSGNVATHLKNGLTGWLFGALAGAGLTLPAQFDLKGIVSIVLQVLGATYERLRGKLANKIGEQKVARLEKAFDFLRTIVTGGLAAAWQKISEFAGNLQEMVIGGIKEWVMHSVITAAITKLISMFNPAGAIIQAVMAIYNTVMFFIERGSQIAALAEAVFNSIGNIAAGNVAGAANYVEQTMGRSLPVMISFLARLIGLGGVSEHIKNVIKKIQTPIENALNKLANFIVEKGKSLLGKGEGQRGGGEQNPQERLDRAMAAAQSAVNRFTGKRVGALVLKPLLSAIRLRYGLKSLELVPDGERWAIEGIVNPKKIETTGVLRGEDLAPSEGKRILLLGEGDFSFALSLAKQVQPAQRSGIVATSYDSETQVKQLYKGAEQNISNLKNSGVTVLHGVDATKIDSSQGLFTGIVFNFPFVPGDRPTAVTRNVAMLQNFFASAAQSLEPGGKVFLTSKEYWLKRFKPVELADSAGLTQDGTPRRFDAGEFPGYQHRESHADVSAADTTTGITYIFKK